MIHILMMLVKYMPGFSHVNHSGSTWTRELTFPLQIVAMVDKLQRVCVIRSLNVIYVDVQIIRCFQEVIGEH